MSQIVITTPSEAIEYEERLRDAAYETQMRVHEISEASDPISFFEEIKFNRVGCNPLDTTDNWNVVEQLNQTFTYLASFRAAVLIFDWHPCVRSLTLNLGVKSGSDIEGACDGGIAAEVFAATHPGSNQKLQKDVKKVQAVEARHKYVFFICPSIGEGKYQSPNSEGVKVWSLG